MKITLFCLRKKAISFQKIAVLVCLIILAFSFSTMAQNPNSAQWASVGGEMVISGNHSFTTTWASHAYSRQDGNKWWRGGFWGKREPLIPWDDAVLNSVAPKKGQITVLGPCNIGLLQYSKKGARIVMSDNKTKAGFVPWTNSRSWENDKWTGTVKDYNVNGEFWGSVPAGTEITLDITAIMNVYNNQGGTGEISYTAPQEIEYEIWFFPREGGKVISITSTSTSGSGKPMPGDLYYTDKECK